VREEKAFLVGNHHIWMPLAWETTRSGASALSHEQDTRISSCERRVVAQFACHRKELSS
jgi:hypothetical protein